MDDEVKSQDVNLTEKELWTLCQAMNVYIENGPVLCVTDEALRTRLTVILAIMRRLNDVDT